MVLGPNNAFWWFQERGFKTTFKAGYVKRILLSIECRCETLIGYSYWIEDRGYPGWLQACPPLTHLAKLIRENVEAMCFQTSRTRLRKNILVREKRTTFRLWINIGYPEWPQACLAFFSPKLPCGPCDLVSHSEWERQKLTIFMNLGEARFAGETVRQSYLLRSRITKSNKNTTRPGQGPPRHPGSPRPGARRHGPDKHNTNTGWSKIEWASLSKRIPAKNAESYLRKKNR